MELGISVIMGIYNCSSTLENALNSLLEQTFQNFEVIMCDDASKDDTLQVAMSFVSRYPKKFVLLKNNENLGLNKTLNKCLKIAKGKYIARMDGDDISLPARFEKEYNFLEDHPEYAIVSTSMKMFDENGVWGQTHTNIVTPTIKDFVRHAPFHCHAPCMIRRTAMLEVGGYTEDQRLLRYEDCNLWYKLYAAGHRGYNFTEPLYMMRDDSNAYKRRTIKSRLRAVYVQWSGFRIVHMPLKYYPYLIVEFFKSVILALIPQGLYDLFRKKKLNIKRNS